VFDKDGSQPDKVRSIESKALELATVGAGRSLSAIRSLLQLEGHTEKAIDTAFSNCNFRNAMLDLLRVGKGFAPQTEANGQESDVAHALTNSKRGRSE
jgi:hypothetical protein